ncbi:MAG: alpha-galactosidase [Nocardioidaceae bacterium]|nr:alpha-galactosidase [Nocardioidaceae bacterium]NUS51320.1 alpha-galactosidase [Nocardioidaceae bacterium]
MLFPPAAPSGPAVTRLVVDDTDPDRLPVVTWAGTSDAVAPEHRFTGLLAPGRGTPLLVEHAHGSFGRPGLRGHRLGDHPTGAARDVAGRAWTTWFRRVGSEVADDRWVLDARDERAGLGLRTEVESLPGGALRARHTLTNLGGTPYLLEGLEVALPVPATATEVLDFTGRHEHERAPQRHGVNDGLWLRESRRGRPGLDSASVVVVGTPGFSFSRGELLAVSVATSGSSVLAVQRTESTETTVSGGELLLPGELVLREGESYSTPWVVCAGSLAGLDPAAHAFHGWQRSLAAHPATQPVTLNVWEAVYFDHDVDRLTRLADLAARVGVERFVLDDGWFLGRRDDRAGLGDWWVDETVWPHGLGPLADHVRELGMQFGLWFEPEMVNPDSRLYREHPDWILSAAGREPLLHRNQQVLDLTNPEVWTYLRDRVDAVLSEHRIDYVKWDHNRDLLEAGSAHHGGAPAAYRQNQAYYALLDDLRRRHPQVAWESCASGGGRIDLGVVERVQRFWTSDMTDALTRQHIQRWTQQLIAPEYLGAHVSAPTSHQTGRSLGLGFRAATAFFLAFGIEWDLTGATEDELEELAGWVALHKQFRPLLHSGRVVRVDATDDTVIAHGVVATDQETALFCHAQLDEPPHNRGCTLRWPGLRRDAAYDLRWIGTSTGSPLPDHGPTGGAPVTGAQCEDIGVWIPRRPPQTALLVHATRRTVECPA